MVILEKERVIFFKTYKTAGTAIETSLNDHLQKEDIQMSFGYGSERRLGQNESMLKIRFVNLIYALRNPLALLVVLKQILRGDEIIHEHTLPWVLELFFPKYRLYRKVLVTRNSEDVNKSNYRMYIRRYGFEDSYDKFISSVGLIDNSYFTKTRILKRDITNLTVLSYDDLRSVEDFFRPFGYVLTLDKRIN